MKDSVGQTAVVFFSRTGHSKRVATTLANTLNATLIELSGARYGPGPLGYMRAGFDSLRQKRGLPPDDVPSLTGFDRVILCGPVWTSYPATPLRTLLKANAATPIPVSLFLTSGNHSPAEKAYAVAESDLGRTLGACATLPNGTDGLAEEDQIMDRFLTDLLKVEHLPR